MSQPDPIVDGLQRMFRHFEGSAFPAPSRTPRKPGRASTSYRLIIAIVLAALLLVVAVAGARELGLFEGTPVSPAMKAQIAADSQGAPAALDPGIDASGAVTMISLPTARGTVTLIVSPASRAGYCDGLAFSWLGGKPGLGCNGPAGRALAIDFGVAVPGRLGTSAVFVYGHVSDARATSIRIKLADGSAKADSLTHGFFLTELNPDASPTRVDALDAHDIVIATQDVSQPVVGIPTK